MSDYELSPKASVFSERVLVLGAIVLALGSGYLIWGPHSFFSRGGARGESIATLVRFHNDVRHKEAGAVSWTPATDRVPLFQADTVFTGNDSTAAVDFRKGARLELGAQSLVVIRDSSDLTELEVETGIVSGTFAADTKVTVIYRGKRHEIRSGHGVARVRFSAPLKAEAPKLEVIDGSAEITIADHAYPVREHETLEVTPAPFVHASLPEVPTVPSDLPNLRMPASVTHPSPLPTPAAPAPLDSDADLNAPFDRAPAEESPRPRPSRTPSFTPPRIDTEEQFYEVSRFVPAKASLWRTIVALMTRVISTEARAEGEFGQSIHSPRTSATDPAPAPIFFHWQKIKGADSYQIQMATEATFLKRSLDEHSEETAYRWALPRVGAFFWRVRAVAADGKTGPWSATGRIQVLAAPPGSETPLLFTYEREGKGATPPAFTLRWKRSAWAEGGYRVQASTDAAFGNTLHDEKTADTRSRVTLPADGTYYWRVKVLERPGAVTENRFSKPYELRVDSHERAPASITPPAESQTTAGPRSDVPSPWKLVVGLGFTQIHYQETEAAALTEISITPRAALTYFFSPDGWSVGGSGFVNAAIAGSSDPNTVRFYGLNLRAGKPVFGAPGGSERLSLYGGWYAVSTFGNAQIGFVRMNGPQIYPTLEFLQASGARILIYGKYSPISPKAGAISFRSNELAGGGSYTFSTRGHTPWSITFDASKLSVNIEDLLYISSTSYTFGVGTSF